MNRKPPFKHPVTGHYRDGKWISRYTRGHGNKPVSRRHRSKPDTVYNITFTFPDGSTETYNHNGTATGALRDAVGDIQRPMLPIRAVLRRQT